jgi:hypothetical protein
MSRRFTILAVAVVSFVLGGLLSHSVLQARADAPAAPGHGKCVGITVVNQMHLCRAFEDGTVEMIGVDDSGRYIDQWKKAGSR